MRHLIILSIITISACEEERQTIYCREGLTLQTREIFIDQECSPNAVEGILDSVDILNAMTQRQLRIDAVEVIGTISVDHSNLYPTDNADVIVCHYQEPDYYVKEEHKLAYVTNSEPNYIHLHLFRTAGYNTSKEYTLAIMLHELLHYIAKVGHSSNLDTVMYPIINIKHDYYTDADVQAFCNSL